MRGVQQACQDERRGMLISQMKQVADLTDVVSAFH